MSFTIQWNGRFPEALRRSSVRSYITLGRSQALSKPNFNFQKRQKELAKKKKSEEKKQRKQEKNTVKQSEDPAAEAAGGEIK
jgi:hypothetical protein